MRKLPSRNERSVPSESDLALLETLFKRRLPESYKSFLRTNNNVWLTAGSEETLLPDQVPIYVDRFYDAISRSGALPELVKENQDYGHRLPAETITIGSDVYGNQILLMLEGEDVGYVLIWDHDNEGFEDAPPDPYHNVYELASDIETFVDAIGRGSSEG